MGRVAAGAGPLPLFWARSIKFQQFAKRRSSRLVQFRGGGKRFRDGLAVLFAGEAKVGTVSGGMGLMTATIRFTTGAVRGGDRSAAKIGQASHFLEDAAALLL